MATIEVFADIGCPFTHIGLRRFVEERSAAGRDDIRLRARAWPLEIVNGHPLDPEFIAEEIADIRTQLATEAFSGFDPAAFPASSLPAHALAAAAYDLDVVTGEAVSLELRDLLFEQGVDVSDRDVLNSVAASHRIEVDIEDHSAVLDDHRLGRERNVTGSPHFFTPDGNFFCPALDVHRDDEDQLRIALDPDGFDRFLGACFQNP